MANNKPKPVLLPTSSAPGNDGYSGGMRLVNLFATKRIVRGKAAVQLSAIHGLTRFKALAGGAIRGMLEVDGYLYVLAGAFLYMRSPSDVWTNIGTIGGSDPVFMARNRTKPVAQVGIVANNQYYLIDNRVLQPTPVSPNLSDPIGIEVFNGRFIFPKSDGTVWASEPDDGATIDALAFGTAEAYSDANKGIGVRSTDVIIFGSESAEFWRDEGLTPWPYLPVHAIPVGCLAGTSIAAINQTVVWVANDRTVRRLSGYEAEVISTIDVQEAIEAAVDDGLGNQIEALVYERAGHKFYKISCDAFTWVWNATTGDWHEEKSYGVSRWRGRGYAALGDLRLVGDYSNGILYQVRPDAYDEDGSRIVCELQTAIDGYPYGMIVDRLYIDGQTGVGINSTDDEDADPELMIDVSTDGGRNFTIQRRAKLGAIGQFDKFPVADMLGTFDGRGARIRVTCSAKVLNVINGMSADIEVLAP